MVFWCQKILKCKFRGCKCIPSGAPLPLDNRTAQVAKNFVINHEPKNFKSIKTAANKQAVDFDSHNDAKFYLIRSNFAFWGVRTKFSATAPLSLLTALIHDMRRQI